MFYGYPISQWVSVGVYLVGMTVLFIGIGLFSAWLDNKLFNNKNKLYKTKKKNMKQKQWFYDVA